MTYRIYVGTYAKYNSGSIKGAWLDLEDYACKQDFYEACAELHSDEADPEYMFQDHEDIPKFFIGETYLSDDIWSYMGCNMDEGVKKAYVEAKEQWDEEDCQSSYIGQFRDYEELAEYLVDDCGVVGEIPDNLKYYFNYEAYGRDIRLSGDVVEENGYFFWNH
jgi:antirestriction protein